MTQQRQIVRPCQHVGRRTLLRGAGGTVVAACGLVGCGGDDEAGSGGTETSGGGGGTTVSAADVPVGGGTIVEETYVVTQPTKGDFKAFSAACTHQGCVVAEVADNTITCNCHGSQFDAETGEPVSGPSGAAASSIDPLPEEPISVDGDTITLG